MLLGFKRQFAPFVKEGSKTHTLRVGRKTLPAIGEPLHCYVDPRQKTMALLGRWPCKALDTVVLMLNANRDGVRSLRMWINDTRLDDAEMNQFCWRDGFRPVRHCDAWIAFSHFWNQTHGAGEFRPDLIHWDYNKPIQNWGNR